MRALFIGVMSLLATQALAVPMSLTHQARLLDANGAPLEGSTDVLLRLVDGEGQPLWARTYAATELQSGYASFVLEGNDDSNTPLGTSVFDNTGVRIEMVVDSVVLGSTPLTSVPYAMTAGHAATADALVGGSDGSARVAAAQDCEALLQSHPSTPDGAYWIDPDGDGDTSDAFRTWCDMTGGGWTMVAQNNRHIPTPVYINQQQSLYEVSVAGGMDSLHGFDILVGLAFWEEIGSSFRQDVGPAPMQVTKRATYSSYDLDQAGDWSISFGSAPMLTGTSTNPGLYVYHQNVAWRAFGGSEVCIDSYPIPWWYTSCWSGNIWGDGGRGSHQSAPYWSTSASTDWSYWGAYWVK